MSYRLNDNPDDPTDPAEQTSRRDSTPGRLSMQQVQRMITVIDEAVAFNNSFVGSLRLDSFHPDSPQAEQHSDIVEPGADVLHALGLDTFVFSVLGRDVSPGVTKAQFQHIMRRCSECRHFCYKERQSAHRCPNGVSWAFKGGPEDLVALLLSRTSNTGLSSMDMHRQFCLTEPKRVTGGSRPPWLCFIPARSDAFSGHRLYIDSRDDWSSAAMEVLLLKGTESTNTADGRGHGDAGELVAPFRSRYLEWLSVQQQCSISTILDAALPFHPRAVPLHFNLGTFHPDAPLKEMYTVDPTPDVLASLGRDFHILSALGRDVGPGITKSEFEYLMSRCVLCTRLCYKERQVAHRCPTTRGSTLWKGGPEDLAAYLLSRVPNGGLGNMDISRQGHHSSFRPHLRCVLQPLGSLRSVSKEVRLFMDSDTDVWEIEPPKQYRLGKTLLYPMELRLMIAQGIARGWWEDVSTSLTGRGRTRPANVSKTHDGFITAFEIDSRKRVLKWQRVVQGYQALQTVTGGHTQFWADFSPFRFLAHVEVVVAGLLHDQHFSEEEVADLGRTLAFLPLHSLALSSWDSDVLLNGLVQWPLQPSISVVVLAFTRNALSTIGSDPVSPMPSTVSLSSLL
ncbi:hypothetical protein NMY22_g9790 [Coprinellus aureogranulatus]|nr:hypothetical protein NMY22_g9790 [Coprinellus aureogranulatus]